MALVPSEYSDRQFNKEENEELKEKVEGCILELPRDIKAPIFKGTSVRDGAIIFNCINE